MRKIITQVCTKCNIEKEVTLENFEPRKENKNGFIKQCRDCRNIRRRENYKSINNTFNYWTDEEKEVLKKYYPIMSGQEIHDLYLPNRTPNQINDHSIKVLKLKKIIYKNRWAEEEVNYLKLNYENLDKSIDEICAVLNKNSSNVTIKANKLGLYRETWKKGDIDILKQYYPYMLAEEVQNKFLPDKTRKQIIATANRHKIYRDKNLRKEVALKNLDKIQNQFGENHPSWVEKVEVACNQCGKSIFRTESKINKSNNKFCSIKCMGEWKSINETGENNNNYGKHWSEEMKLRQAENSVKLLLKLNNTTKITKPQQTINELLDELNIDFIPEYNCKYYLLDNFLYKYNLGIEVQGNFFHCNPVMQLNNTRKEFIVRKDKSKNTYVRKYHGFNILYLWEKDIKENPDLCKMLILYYIEKEGILNNYHSFNYYLENNNIKLSSNIIKFNY